MKKIQITSGGDFFDSHCIVMLSDKLRHVLTYGYKLRLYRRTEISESLCKHRVVCQRQQGFFTIYMYRFDLLTDKNDKLQMTESTKVVYAIRTRGYFTCISRGDRIYR